MSHQLLQCSVIHIIPHDGVGGVEVAARSMLDSKYLNDNFKLFLIAGKSLSKNKKNVVESPYKSANNPFSYFRAIYKIYIQAPDVLVCSLWRSVPIGVMVKLLRSKTKLVFFLHLASTVHCLDSSLHKLMMRFCDFIWADSLTTLNARIRHISSYKTHIISFVTQRLSPATVADKPVLLHFVFWGRINHQKGLDRAIEFINAVVDAGYNCRFDIWGPNDGEQENLIQQINALGLSDIITFKGLADYSKLPSISVEHCFYLQLSRIEGMAMSVLEAMQLGLVPVVTPVGEIGRYCIDKENSIIVHDVNKLKESITFLASLLKDKKQFKKLRDNAINTWKGKPLYERDFISASNSLIVE